MYERRGRLGVGLIVIYLVFFCVFCIRTFSKESPAAEAQVLGTQIVTFPVASDIPELNKLYAKVNASRQAAGSLPLAISSELTNLAQSRADDMASKSYFSHQSPSGTYYYDSLKNGAFAKSYSCENLELSSLLDTQVYINQWLISTAGHKECLLNKTTNQIGLGAAKLPFDPAKSDSSSYVIVAIQAN